jgi:hypothetical protein
MWGCGPTITPRESGPFRHHQKVHDGDSCLSCLHDRIGSGVRIEGRQYGAGICHFFLLLSLSNEEGPLARIVPLARNPQRRRAPAVVTNKAKKLPS